MVTLSTCNLNFLIYIRVWELKLNPVKKAGKDTAKSKPKSQPKRSDKKEDSLRDRILRECIQIVSEQGSGAINMREISRRLKISHTAPYKHFNSKEDVLSELGILGFKMFNETLEKNLCLPESKIALLDRFRQLKLNYEEFATKYPELYQIIFHTKLPDKEKYPELKEVSTKAFAILLNQVASMKAVGLIGEEDTFASSLVIYILMHGYMTLKNNSILEGLSNLFEYDQSIEDQMDRFLSRVILLKPESDSLSPP